VPRAGLEPGFGCPWWILSPHDRCSAMCRNLSKSSKIKAYFDPRRPNGSKLIGDGERRGAPACGNADNRAWPRQGRSLRLLIELYSNNYSSMCTDAFRLSYHDCRELLTKWLAEPPPTRIQLLAGPRQVGKTTLLLELAERFRDTERVSSGTPRICAMCDLAIGVKSSAAMIATS